MIGVILSVLLTIMSVYILVQSKKRKKIPDNYWDIVGISTLDHNSIITKDNNETISMPEKIDKIYKAYKAQGLRHMAHIQHFRPTYTALDPDIIRRILVEDFDHFLNRGVNEYDEVNDPLSAYNLFNLEDERWRQWRDMLTPIFQTGKMRIMFPTIVECSKPMKDILHEHAMSQTPVDIKELLACYTTDVIASCAFGIECNCLKNPDAEFSKQGRNYITEECRINQSRSDYNKNKLTRILQQRSIFEQYPKAIKDSTKFFVNLVKNTMENRANDKIHRPDTMHMLMNIKNHGSTDDIGTVQKNISITELTAQAFMFDLAGFETCAPLMTMVCYELATNSDVQEKLRTEILSMIIKHDGLTYESVNEMTYLEQVLNETMRLHPPLPQLSRIVTKNYHIPGTDIVLEKGTDVRIDTCAIQRDSDYYDNPDRFDPENFSKERIESRPAFTFLPFGGGPRNCIGMRFGKLQSKIGIIALLRYFKLTMNKKTKYPIRYNPGQCVVQANGEVFLDVQRIS